MKPISALSCFVGDSASLLYLAVFAITIYDVALRYFFDSPTVWGLELVIALAGLQYVLGGAQAIRDDAHVRIDFVYRMFPPRLQRAMDVLSYLLMIGFFGLIVWYGGLQAQSSWLRGETTGAGWNSHAPMVMKFAIPIGAALMALQAMAMLVVRIGELRRVGSDRVG